ncbi:MAG: cupredoxin domain-containing protein [Actinobacteria bacterium]|nr:cupredoxin domain-containing protein [Actinomycetota bacterium]
MRKTFILLLALLAFASAACGGDDDPTVPRSPTVAPSPTQAVDETPSGSPDCDDRADAATANLVLDDNFFEPDCVIVGQQAAIHLTNRGQATHTFTIPETDVDVQLAPGGEQTLPGPSPVPPGDYVFYCRFHGSAAGGGMAGTITIV